jgi:hypothetical protein
VLPAEIVAADLKVNEERRIGVQYDAPAVDYGDAFLHVFQYGSHQAAPAFHPSPGFRGSGFARGFRSLFFHCLRGRWVDIWEQKVIFILNGAIERPVAW